MPDASDKSETRGHKCNTSVTRVKIFDFDKNTSKNIFTPPYISSLANEKREEQFHSRNYLLEMPRSHAKMLLKSALQKLKIVMAKAIYQIVTTRL